MGRIVVGVDGSHGSRRAVEWAAEEAKLRNARLELVSVYSPPRYSDSIGGAEQAEATFMGPRREAESALEAFGMELDGVRMEHLALEHSSAANALVEHSRGADMLVVGARGLGAFKSLVLGSVGIQLAQHAEVPLVIIRK